MLLGQQPLDLALGDRQADRLQQSGQTRQCRLALMVLHQHEAAQASAEMPLRPLRQRRDDHPAVRCQPAFTPVADRVYRQHKILHQIGLIALEAGPRWRWSLEQPVIDADARSDLAATPSLLSPGALGRFSGPVHAAGLDVGATFQSL